MIALAVTGYGKESEGMCHRRTGREREIERERAVTKGTVPCTLRYIDLFKATNSKGLRCLGDIYNGFHGAFLSRWISLSVPAGGGNNLWNGKEGYGLVKGTSTKGRMRLSDKPPCSAGGRTHARGQCALILDPPIVGWLDLEGVRNGFSRIMALDDATRPQGERRPIRLADLLTHSSLVRPSDSI